MIDWTRHWVLLWCQTVMSAVLKSAGDARRTTSNEEMPPRLKNELQKLVFCPSVLFGEDSCSRCNWSQYHRHQGGTNWSVFIHFLWGFLHQQSGKIDSVCVCVCACVCACVCVCVWAWPLSSVCTPCCSVLVTLLTCLSSARQPAVSISCPSLGLAVALLSGSCASGSAPGVSGFCLLGSELGVTKGNWFCFCLPSWSYLWYHIVMTPQALISVPYKTHIHYCVPAVEAQFMASCLHYSLKEPADSHSPSYSLLILSLWPRHQTCCCHEAILRFTPDEIHTWQFQMACTSSLFPHGFNC